MLNIRGETLSEVEMYTLVDTLVERQAKMQVKSLKNPLAKSKKAAGHNDCKGVRGVG